MKPSWLLEYAGVDEALAGDLAEAFAATSSLSWYWRQALTAIAAHWLQTIVAHKWLAARAVITGWVIWASAALLLGYLRHAAGQAEWMTLAIPLVRYGDWLVIGWTIGMLHRPYSLPMVFSYVGFTLLMSIPTVSRIVIDGLGHPSYTPPSATMILFATVSLLAGGLISAARLHASPSRVAGSGR